MFGNKEEENKNKNLGIYTIFDKLSNRYGAPLIDHNDQLAIRYFEMLCNNVEKNDKSPFKKSDYEFYKLGEYNQELGEIILLEKKEFLIAGNTIEINKEQEQKQYEE